MSRISEKDLDSVTRRMSAIATHLVPVRSPSAPASLEFSNVSSMNDSYHRKHGDVSSEPIQWRLVESVDSGEPFTDILYEKAVGEDIAKVTINRPERRNAFRAKTVREMMRAFTDAREDGSIGVIILTGKGTQAFSSGGDQAFRASETFAEEGLNVFDLQAQIRRLPKPVIAMVAGYAVGGGHVLHMVCDITIAAENAVFGQSGPKVASFDAGYGCSIMSRLVGPKKAREMWFLARFYNAAEADKIGLVNKVVPVSRPARNETVKWCREILRNSPTSIRILKSALNAVDDGHAGLHTLGGDATLIFYGTEEGNEGKKSFMEHRRPDFSKFSRKP